MPGHFPPTLCWREDGFKLVFQFNNWGNEKKNREGETLPYFKEIIEANLLCLSKAVDPAKWVIVADFASFSYRHHRKKKDPKLRDEIEPEQK